jgi:hypothetical protein
MLARATKARKPQSTLRFNGRADELHNLQTACQSLPYTKET